MSNAECQMAFAICHLPFVISGAFSSACARLAMTGAQDSLGVLQI
jgi:hypothetical protein